MPSMLFIITLNSQNVCGTLSISSIPFYYRLSDPFELLLMLALRFLLEFLLFYKGYVCLRDPVRRLCLRKFEKNEDVEVDTCRYASAGVAVVAGKFYGLYGIPLT